MKIVMMACTARGFEAMRRCEKSLKEILPAVEILTYGRCSHVSGFEDKPKLSELTAEWFERADALVFFTAAGIAVRCIAPFVSDKFHDPAVLVVYESARLVIPLLSGHAGGANRCRDHCKALDSQPVITTATDGRDFCVDVFVVENGLSSPMTEQRQNGSLRGFSPVRKQRVLIVQIVQIVQAGCGFQTALCRNVWIVTGKGLCRLRTAPGRISFSPSGSCRKTRQMPSI